MMTTLTETETDCPHCGILHDPEVEREDDLGHCCVACREAAEEEG